MHLIGDKANVKGGPSLLMVGSLGPSLLCVCDGSRLSVVKHTVPGEVCRPVTLVEVRLPKMDRAGS